MPRHLQVLVNCFIFLALLLIVPGRVLAQLSVEAGQPVGLTAFSNPGAASSTPCGPDNSYTCYGGTVPPNGNIHWTVDGAPASSSYDTVNSSGSYCSADGNVNYYTYCYSYWDESGFYAVLPVGDHVVTASIPTSQDYSAAFSTSWAVHVTKPVPSLSVSCSPNPITFGNENTNCTASQSAGTGSLTWTINGGGWTTTGINGNAGGFAGWSAGNYTIGITYSGDNDYGSASSSTVLTINKSASNVIVSCNPNPISYGSQTSTCIAQAPGSGTITTYWDENTWCSGAAPGPVSCTGWNGQPIGNHTFSANYSGDGNYNGSSASTILAINKATPTISVSCSPNPITFGPQTSNCTATVGGGATGTVSFQDNGYTWATPSLSGGQTSAGGFNYDGAGNHTVTVIYNGDGNFDSVSATTTLTINKANTFTQIYTNATPANVGQSVTFSALVNTGGAVPTGTVAFLNGGSQIGNESISVVSTTNLVPYSQQIGNPATWGGYCGSLSNTTANTGDLTAPDGTTTATKWVVDGGFCASPSGTSNGAISTFSGGLATGQSYTVSTWMRGAVGGEYVELGLNDCALVGIQLTTTWTRYSQTFSDIPSGSSGCATGPRGLQFRGIGGTYYIWGAQTEQSTTVGPYIQTDASARDGYGGVSTLVTNALGEGTHAISASYSGDSNSLGSSSSPISEVVIQPVAGAPAISSLSPSSGVVGTSVTLTGMNFGANQGSSSVIFSGINATVMSWSDTSITIQVPVNAISGNVIVTVNGTPSNSILFTVNTGTPTQSATIYSYAIKDCSNYSSDAIKDCNGNSGYAPNGNVVAYSDSVNGAWSNIGYDGVNRLTNATQSLNGITQNMCWTYDSFGNRTSSVCNPSSYIQYPASNRDPSLQYDATGDVTGDGAHQYLYDAEGRVCAVQYTVMTIPAMIGYIYDAEGRRVAKGSISQWNCDMDNNGFAETGGYVLGPNGEQMTETDGQSNWVHTNVYANGELIATYTPSGLSFHLNDWLGTRRMDTDVFGSPGASYQSLPFGELLNSAQIITSPEHFFTGKERDSESGLDYFGARYYGSSMGRWMSPDWADKPEAVPYSDLANPQSLNLYGYVNNNPLSHADADGHEQQLLTPEEVQRGNDVFVGAIKGVWNLGASVWNTGANLLNVQGATSGMSFGIPTAPIAQYSNDIQHLAGDVAQLGVIVADAAASLTRGTAAADAVATPKAPTVPDSIPAGPSPRPTSAQQSAINEMGNAHGCSTCGTTSPGTKTGNWVGDHQPPTALNPKGSPQVYKPQCLQCSRRQGGEVAAQIRANKKEQTPQ
jgi:RHS repeat-associated protein